MKAGKKTLNSRRKLKCNCFLLSYPVSGSTVTYYCRNKHQITTDKFTRTCGFDGQWSVIDQLPACHDKNNVIMLFGKNFVKDKHLAMYGIAALTLLFVSSALILFHVRRLAKKISRQMRENLYKKQPAFMSQYSNDSHYNDFTVWTDKEGEENESETKY